MLERIAQSLVVGDPRAWSVIASLWLFSLVAVWLNRRDAQPSQRLVFSLLFASSLTSITGALVSTAVCIPHLRWTQRPAGELLAAEGESWRKLRGPWAIVNTRAGPDVAIPTMDAQGQWALFGLFSESALPDFEPAADTAPTAGQPRLCPPGSGPCRAWPAAWPEPLQAQGTLEFVFSANGALYAAAYDRETQKYLIGAVRGLSDGDRPEILSADELANTNALELIGRIGTPPPRGALTSLFVARRMMNGHFEQARIVAAGKADDTFTFSLERAQANIQIGNQFMRFVARPAMLLCSITLPLMLLTLLICTSILSIYLKKRLLLTPHVQTKALKLELLPKSPGSKGPLTPARVLETAILGEKTLNAGDVVALLIEAERDNERIASNYWYELPGVPTVASNTGEIIVHPADEARNDRPGVLVAAQGHLFRRAALSWIRRPVYLIALISLGCSAFIPGFSALVGLWASH